MFTGNPSEVPSSDHTNTYIHPSGSANYQGVFIYQTDADSFQTTNAEADTVPTLRTIFTDFNDNSKPQSNSAYTNVALDYSIHRKDTLPSTTINEFDTTDIDTVPQAYEWNPQSSLTTVSVADADADGLPETDPNGDNEASRSAVLKYTVHDQSGNRASCTVDIVVVDLQDQQYRARRVLD